MELNILDISIGLFLVFAFGFLVGIRNEKGLWQRNCLRDMPHYSDGIPYVVTKLGVPYYGDETYIGGMQPAHAPSPSACKASPSGCKSESAEKVIAALKKIATGDFTTEPHIVAREALAAYQKESE